MKRGSKEKAEAVQRGETTYLGAPCTSCGGCERTTTSSRCVSCTEAVKLPNPDEWHATAKAKDVWYEEIGERV